MSEVRRTISFLKPGIRVEIDPGIVTAAGNSDYQKAAEVIRKMLQRNGDPDPSVVNEIVLIAKTKKVSFEEAVAIYREQH